MSPQIPRPHGRFFLLVLDSTRVETRPRPAERLGRAGGRGRAEAGAEAEAGPRPRPEKISKKPWVFAIFRQKNSKNPGFLAGFGKHGFFDRSRWPFFGSRMGLSGPVLVSQSPSMDGHGVFFRRPEACFDRFWTGRAWENLVLHSIWAAGAS